MIMATSTEQALTAPGIWGDLLRGHLFPFEKALIWFGLWSYFEELWHVKKAWEDWQNWRNKFVSNVSWHLRENKNQAGSLQSGKSRRAQWVSHFPRTSLQRSQCPQLGCDRQTLPPVLCLLLFSQMQLSQKCSLWGWLIRSPCSCYVFHKVGIYCSEAVRQREIQNCRQNGDREGEKSSYLLAHFGMITATIIAVRVEGLPM